MPSKKSAEKAKANPQPKKAKKKPLSDTKTLAEILAAQRFRKGMENPRRLEYDVQIDPPTNLKKKIKKAKKKLKRKLEGMDPEWKKILFVSPEAKSQDPNNTDIGPFDFKNGPPIIGIKSDEWGFDGEKFTAQEKNSGADYAPSILQPDTPAAKHPGGRPSIYSKKLGNQIFVHMCEGLSLRAIAALPGMPAKSTILRWLFEDDSKEFQDQYTRARQIQAESELDETKEIADDDTEDVRFEKVTRNHVDVEVAVFVKAAIARAALRIQARETRLKLFNQQKYGALMRHGGMDSPDIKHSIAQEIRQAHGKEG